MKPVCLVIGAGIGGTTNGLTLSEKIPETYLHLARQHRFTWSHEIDLRSYSELAWWNSWSFTDQGTFSHS